MFLYNILISGVQARTIARKQSLLTKLQQWNVNATGMENTNKSASMGTVQPDGGRAGRAAAARKPHQWKRSLKLHSD